MGLTVLSQDWFGRLKVLVGSHVMPASYVLGGDLSDPTSFSPIAEPLPRMTTIRAVIILGAVDGRVYQYDYANKKIVAYQQAGAAGPFAEVGAGVT